MYITLRYSASTPRTAVVIEREGMDEGDKLAIRLILGIALLIGGTYALFLLFGESRLISIVVIIGWFVLAAYCLKYHNLFKKRR